MLCAFFHYNDFIGLQLTATDMSGPWSPSHHQYTPAAFQPCFYNTLQAFPQLQNPPLDILLNVAYNAGSYSALFTATCNAASGATQATVAQFDSVLNSPIGVWGQNSFHQYPYQIRSYLDQLYDKKSQDPANQGGTIQANNHVVFSMNLLATVFQNVFSKLAYTDSNGHYKAIPASSAASAFQQGLSAASVSSSASLDLSDAGQRAQIFSVLENSITDLEMSLGFTFTQRTLKTGAIAGPPVAPPTDPCA